MKSQKTKIEETRGLEAVADKKGKLVISMVDGKNITIRSSWRNPFSELIKTMSALSTASENKRVLIEDGNVTTAVFTDKITHICMIDLDS